MTTARIVNLEPGLLQSLQARQQFQEAAQAQLADARANGARLSWEMGGRVFTLGDVVIGAGAFFAARAFGLKGMVPALAAVGVVWIGHNYGKTHTGISQSYHQIRAKIDAL